MKHNVSNENLIVWLFLEHSRFSSGDRPTTVVEQDTKALNEHSCRQTPASYLYLFDQHIATNSSLSSPFHNRQHLWLETYLIWRSQSPKTHHALASGTLLSLVAAEWLDVAQSAFLSFPHQPIIKTLSLLYSPIPVPRRGAASANMSPILKWRQWHRPWWCPVSLCHSSASSTPYKSLAFCQATQATKHLPSHFLWNENWG